MMGNCKSLPWVPLSRPLRTSVASAPELHGCWHRRSWASPWQRRQPQSSHTSEQRCSRAT
ncbi:unnamed protein product [Ixodes pacificus]